MDKLDTVCKNIKILDECIECKIENTEKGRKDFYKIWLNNWYYECDEVNWHLHLEGDLDNLLLHFEIYPYQAIDKLEERIRKEHGQKVLYLRDLFENLDDMKYIKQSKIRKNATLTIAKFQILIDDIDLIIKNIYKLMMGINSIVEDIRQ